MAQIKTKRERVKFASDNVTGACPEVLDAILKANDGDRTPYGNDQISLDLQDKNKKIKKRKILLIILNQKYETHFFFKIFLVKCY